MKNPHSERAATPATNPGRAATDAVLGAAAGAVGVWSMDQVGWLMLRTENARTLARDLQARPDGDAAGTARAGVTAQIRAVQRSPMFGKDTAAGTLMKAAQVSGVSDPDQQPGPAAAAFHFALGMLPGALYGVARRVRPSLSTGHGTLYGLGLFVVMDEIAAPLTSIASGPKWYPWQAHARGLVAHLVLGVTTEALLHAADHFRHTGRR